MCCIFIVIECSKNRIIGNVGVINVIICSFEIIETIFAFNELLLLIIKRKIISISFLLYIVMLTPGIETISLSDRFFSIVSELKLLYNENISRERILSKG